MEVFAGLATSESSSSFSLENTRAYLQKHLVHSFVFQWGKYSTENVNTVLQCMFMIVFIVAITLLQVTVSSPTSVGKSQSPC